MYYITDKTVKLWKISERERKMAEGSFNLRHDDGSDRNVQGELILPRLVPMELIVEASPRRVCFSYTYLFVTLATTRAIRITKVELANQG